MIDQQTYLAQLMSEKLAGIISPEDERLLDGLMAAEPALRQQWERYRERFSEKDLQEADNIEWQPLRRRSRTFRLKPAHYAAAAVVAGVAAMFAFWPSARPVALPDDAVRLTLAGGQQVDLSAARETKVNGAQLAGTDSSLRYTAGAATPEGWNTLYVPAGKSYQITLGDGTLVWLNAASTLKFPFRFGASRTVVVSGEAYFEVAADASRPFIVEGEGSKVKVLGTSFNVNNYNPRQQALSLVSGKVQLQHEGRELLLQPGTQAVYGIGHAAVTQAFDLEKTISWRQGVYYFDGAGLKDIAEVLPRWYGVVIKMDNPAAAAQRFTGRLLKPKPLHEFLEQLKATTAIDYYFDEEKVLHFK